MRISSVGGMGGGAAKSSSDWIVTAHGLMVNPVHAGALSQHKPASN
jgi:hypothetical protein